MPRPSQPSLRTERLLLRQFELQDAPAVQRLAGAREIADTTLMIPHPYEDGMAERWIESHAKAFDAGEQIIYAVTDGASQQLLGCVDLRVDRESASAELGYWIGTPFWRLGYAAEAAGAVVDFGIRQLGLNRIHAHHLLRNPASGKVMQKLGMAYEGIIRNGVSKWGRLEDIALYSLLARDWRGALRTGSDSVGR